MPACLSWFCPHPQAPSCSVSEPSHLGLPPWSWGVLAHLVCSSDLWALRAHAGVPQAFPEHWGSTYTFRSISPWGSRAAEAGLLATERSPQPCQRWLPLLLGMAGPWPPLGARSQLRPAPLPLKQQVAPSCLRSCSCVPPASPCPGVFISIPASRLAFTSGTLLLWMREPLGFLSASCSAVPHSYPRVGEVQGESAQGFALLFHAPVCTPLAYGARLCLSS